MEKFLHLQSMWFRQLIISSGLLVSVWITKYVLAIWLYWMSGMGTEECCFRIDFRCLKSRWILFLLCLKLLPGYSPVKWACLPQLWVPHFANSAHTAPYICHCKEDISASTYDGSDSAVDVFIWLIQELLYFIKISGYCVICSFLMLCIFAYSNLTVHASFTFIQLSSWY